MTKELEDQLHNPSNGQRSRLSQVYNAYIYGKSNNNSKLASPKNKESRSLDQIAFERKMRK